MFSTKYRYDSSLVNPCTLLAEPTLIFMSIALLCKFRDNLVNVLFTKHLLSTYFTYKLKWMLLPNL